MGVGVGVELESVVAACPTVVAVTPVLFVHPVRDCAPDRNTISAHYFEAFVNLISPHTAYGASLTLYRADPDCPFVTT